MLPGLKANKREQKAENLLSYIYFLNEVMRFSFDQKSSY